MALTRLNNRSVSAVTTLPAGVLTSSINFSQANIQLPSGHHRKIYTSYTTTEVTTATTSSVNVVGVTVPMNTDLYNYFIVWHTPIKRGSASTETDGVNMYILVDSTVISTVYHRLFSTNLNTYANQSIDRYVTTGFSGGSNRTIYGAVSSYNGTSGDINTHDNSPDATSTGSRITVWEYYK